MGSMRTWTRSVACLAALAIGAAPARASDDFEVKLKERVRTLGEAVTAIGSADVIKSGRNEACVAGEEEAARWRVMPSADQGFVAVAFQAQLAFDAGEAPQIKSAYLAATQAERNAWSTKAQQAADQVARRLEVMAKFDAADTALANALVESIRQLRAHPGLNDVPGGAKILLALDRLEDRAAGVQVGFVKLRALEQAERAAAAALGGHAGQESGTRYGEERWYRIAYEVDRDEANWARSGGDERSEGWSVILERTTLAQARINVAAATLSSRGAHELLETSRATLSKEIELLRSLRTNLQDIVDLVLELRRG